MSKQIVLDTKYVGDIIGTFYVPSYQRGYRWGVEEFIMIMTDTDMNGCAKKAEELRKLIEANDCVTDEYTVHHTMSFGVTEFDPSKSIEANISDADQKLYTAKESGRNRVIA